MYNHPLYNNAYDFRGFSTIPIIPTASRSAPSFLNIAKAKPSFLSKIGSGFSLSKITTMIGNAQKVLNIYNQVSPIIKQAKPIINNLKTTLKVAKAFKSFSQEDSLEKAFDNLPDYNKQELKEETIKKETKEKESIEEEQKGVPSPFFVR